MGVALHRKLIAAVALVAILVTGVGVSQGRASEFRAEQALAALLGLAVIGAVIADRNRDDRNTTAVTRRALPTITPRALPRRAARQGLPERCLRILTTGRSRSEVFANRCLERNYGFVNRLPSKCERRIRTDRGSRMVWSARCLRRNGFEIASH